MNGSMTSSGNPCGYVGKGVGVTMPMCSQWPVVVSFPFDRSRRRPATAGAPGCGGQPSSGSTLPSPSASRLGRSRPPTALATLPRVFEPSSPYSPASGNSPAPTASSTITHARGTALFYGGFGGRPRACAFRRLHRWNRRSRRGDHVRRDQALPDGAEPQEAGRAGRPVGSEGRGERRRSPLPQGEARRRRSSQLRRRSARTPPAATTIAAATRRAWIR